jgi:flagellar FliJ protein
LARHKARELMQVAEEKLEVLTEKMQEHKLLEKLKEKKREEYRRERNKDMQKENDDLALMRFDSKEPA